MEKVEVHEGENGIDFFSLHVDGKEVGRMLVTVGSGILQAGYTTVGLSQRKSGYGRKLVDAAAAYARENDLKIVPKCGFVAMMFQKYPETYADIRADN